MGRKTQMTDHSLKNEELCSYAALILADAGEDVTADNMNKLISAAGADVPSYYLQIFEKFDGMRSPKEMVEDAGKVGSGAPGGAAPAAGSGSAPAAAAKKESPPNRKVLIWLVVVCSVRKRPGNCCGPHEQYSSSHQ